MSRPRIRSAGTATREGDDMLTTKTDPDIEAAETAAARMVAPVILC
jgi:hypothetical protein